MNDSYNTDGLRDINKVIKELDEKISDAQWEGRDQQAMHMQFIRDHYAQLRDQGAKYVPEF